MHERRKRRNSRLAYIERFDKRGQRSNMGQRSPWRRRRHRLQYPRWHVPRSRWNKENGKKNNHSSDDRSRNRNRATRRRRLRKGAENSKGKTHQNAHAQVDCYYETCSCMRNLLRCLRLTQNRGLCLQLWNRSSAQRKGEQKV